jgi:hypothetical protein
MKTFDPYTQPPRRLRFSFREPGVSPFHSLKLPNKQIIKILEKSHKKIYWFGYARTAAEFGISMLGLKPGDEVLVPYYICCIVLPLFYRRNIQIQFYSLNNLFQPDLPRMKSLISSKTKALLVVNYFGFLPDFSIIQDFCNRNNLYLFEDNAGGFGSEQNGILAGSFGDISITSIRKTLPIMNGAYLAVNNSNILRKTPNDPQLLKEKRFVHNLTKSLYQRLTQWSPLFYKSHEYVDPEYNLSVDMLKYCDYSPYRLSSLSLFLLKRLNLNKIINHRRKKYNTWRKWLSQFSDVSPVFPHLPQGINPQCFPIYTDRRNDWLKWGAEYNIDVHYWPDMSKEQQTPETIELWQKICCFPIP